MKWIIKIALYFRSIWSRLLKFKVKFSVVVFLSFCFITIPWIRICFWQLISTISNKTNFIVLTFLCFCYIQNYWQTLVLPLLPNSFAAKSHFSLKKIPGAKMMFRRGVFSLKCSNYNSCSGQNFSNSQILWPMLKDFMKLNGCKFL